MRGRAGIILSANRSASATQGIAVEALVGVAVD